ncbi:FmdB family zinc ribbon protein [Geodermatophilus sp. CPCC 206100]|uniref:FmdB family zinc ribbon protein n=1 Tax=Geodermatophilus sp. CPCC 206100 TaxID=3020054 RepID=UPI003B001E92
MPTYQYACTNTDGKHEFEVVQSFTDAAVSECPTCSSPVRKVYGSVGVVFKGSGFYRTDSRSNSSSTESSSTSSTGAKKESTPAAATAGTTGSSSSTSSSSSSAGSSGKAAAAS